MGEKRKGLRAVYDGDDDRHGCGCGCGGGLILCSWPPSLLSLSLSLSSWSSTPRFPWWLPASPPFYCTCWTLTTTCSKRQVGLGRSSLIYRNERVKYLDVTSHLARPGSPGVTPFPCLLFLQNRFCWTSWRMRTQEKRYCLHISFLEGYWAALLFSAPIHIAVGKKIDTFWCRDRTENCTGVHLLNSVWTQSTHETPSMQTLLTRTLG